jgi:hypothetical protein
LTSALRNEGVVGFIDALRFYLSSYKLNSNNTEENVKIEKKGSKDKNEKIDKNEKKNMVGRTNSKDKNEENFVEKNKENLKKESKSDRNSVSTKLDSKIDDEDEEMSSIDKLILSSKFENENFEKTENSDIHIPVYPDEKNALELLDASECLCESLYRLIAAIGIWCMCVCVCMYMCVYTYIYMCVCLCMCVYVYT